MSNFIQSASILPNLLGILSCGQHLPYHIAPQQLQEKNMLTDLASICVKVTFTNGNDVKAKVMGIDEDKDLAVLYVDPAKLSTEVGTAS